MFRRLAESRVRIYKTRALCLPDLTSYCPILLELLAETLKPIKRK